MSDHPIEGLMLTAMNSIKDMVDVNTIIGEPIQASNNTVIIPISKVSFVFAAGGSGAGVSINPIAFIVVQSNVVKLLPVDHSNTLDKILDYVPDIIEKMNCMMNKCIQNKKDLGEKIINNIKKQNEENKKEEKESKEDKKEKVIIEETTIQKSENEQE